MHIIFNLLDIPKLDDTLYDNDIKIIKLRNIIKNKLKFFLNNKLIFILIIKNIKIIIKSKFSKEIYD